MIPDRITRLILLAATTLALSSCVGIHLFGGS